MVAGEIIAAVVSMAATASLLALRKSKCFVRKLRSGFEWGLGFTDTPLVVNELSVSDKDRCED